MYEYHKMFDLSNLSHENVYTIDCVLMSLKT